LFSDVNVSQGSVATYTGSGGIACNQFTANLLGNLPVKKIVNRLKFDRIMAMRLWPHILAHPVDSLRGKWKKCKTGQRIIGNAEIGGLDIADWTMTDECVGS